MKKYLLSILVAIVVLFVAVNAYCCDNKPYEQKPHLEIKCPCGASFVTYEWINADIIKSAEKFLENHKCGHNNVKQKEVKE